MRWDALAVFLSLVGKLIVSHDYLSMVQAVDSLWMFSLEI